MGADNGVAALHERVLREKPRYIDARRVYNERLLGLNDARFREMVADIAAPLHGKPKDEIAGEDIQRHRQTIRPVRLAVAVLAIQALLASGARSWRSGSAAPPLRNAIWPMSDTWWLCRASCRRRRTSTPPINSRSRIC